MRFLGASGLVATWLEMTTRPQACPSFFLAGLPSPEGPLRIGMSRNGVSDANKVPLWTLHCFPTPLS